MRADCTTTYQGDNETLRELQQVSPQDGALHLRRPLPLDPLQVNSPSVTLCITCVCGVLRCAHLQQPLDQDLVLVQKRLVSRVDSCQNKPSA